MRLVDATTSVLMTIAIGHLVVAQGVRATARFEVVAVRPVADPSPFFKLSQVSERVLRVTARGQLVGRADIRTIVSFAYGAEPYERTVTADPIAARSLEEQFEIRALPPESSSPPSREEVRAMTRLMLAERFGMKVRIDTELVSATVLRMIKPSVLGPGLRPAPEGCTQLPPDSNPYDAKLAEAYRRSCVLTFLDDRIRGTMTIDDFARQVSFLGGRAILNRTDLEGMFAIDVAVAMRSFMRAAPARPGSPWLGPTGQSDAPAFVDALRDQMGLTTRTERQPIRLFVVEHVGPLVEN